MSNAVYVMCALTSLGCVYLLMRSYHRNPTALVFWSIVCFWGLALNNILLVIDLILLPASTDLSLIRTCVGCLAVSAMAFGLIWETAE